MENLIATRPFGRADVRVSAIGLGGFHIGVPEDPDVAVDMVRTAVDGGITFMDNSWDYHGGESERRMGRALAGGYRDRVFLMTKLDSRTRDGTLRQLEESLTRLQTDHLDLLQLHEVIREGDAEDALGHGRAIDAYLELKEQGVVRFLGFTGHKDPEIHLSMILAALERGIVFDSVQMPVNAFDANFRSFRERVVPVCQEHGIAVIGMKPLGSGKLVDQAGLAAPTLLRWALSQPLSVVVTGCESIADVEQALEVGQTFQPLDEAELQRISRAARPLAESGALEQYKTTTAHDGTSRNPQWMD